MAQPNFDTIDRMRPSELPCGKKKGGKKDHIQNKTTTTTKGGGLINKQVSKEINE